jgi:hypothetical protein
VWTAAHEIESTGAFVWLHQNHLGFLAAEKDSDKLLISGIKNMSALWPIKSYVPILKVYFREGE